MNSISDIKHTFYINLDHRTDRKQHVETQLSSLGINNYERFKAIKLPNGALGCSMSHLKCLEIAKQNNWEHLLIVEDDIQFLNPKLFINQFNTFIQKHKQFDVLLFAGNNLPPYTKIDDTCIKVKKCQTTTGYFVQNHYFDTLINNIKTGIKNLMREPQNHVIYAIDKFWFQLQEKDLWYLIIPLTVIQKEDYSDIEKKQTNYTRMMTDLDKPWFIQPFKQQFKMNLK